MDPVNESGRAGTMPPTPKRGNVSFVASLRRLWRHRLFRRLLTLRVAAQAADGAAQVGTAAYVLFSPQQQPDAWSIAGVLAITLLPFSILGPFVGVVLDRWSRRDVIAVTALVRAVVCVALAALIVGGQRGGPVAAAFFVAVLISMSLGRFLGAGLAAAMPHTVEVDEYLLANSVMPIVGPVGALIGAGLAGALRLGLAQAIPTHQADAIVFTLAAGLFALSLMIVWPVGRLVLGPEPDAPRTRATDVVRGLVAAVAHLRERRPAGVGLVTIGVHRIWHGVVMAGSILLFRNYFHAQHEVNAAMGDLGLWAGATAAGFVLASFVTPAATARLGLRRWLIVLLTVSAVLQVVPGSIFERWAQVAAAFAIGIGAQSIKICVDTLVQAHVGDGFKGRVFVLYDMVFNVVQVGSAVLAAMLLPADGAGFAVFVAMGVGYLLTGIGFAAVTRGQDAAYGLGGAARERA